MDNWPVPIVSSPILGTREKGSIVGDGLNGDNRKNTPGELDFGLKLNPPLNSSLDTQLYNDNTKVGCDHTRPQQSLQQIHLPNINNYFNKLFHHPLPLSATIFPRNQRLTLLCGFSK